ncbi:MAG TPA: hypothetical protein VGK24_02770 [Candidatus Angelobacter sp.]
MQGKKIPITKEQILKAIQDLALKLGHPPTTTEFTRLSGINDRNASRLFKTYLSAVRAAGLEPNKRGQRLGSAELLADWGEVVRKVGWPPTRREYLREGRYGYIVFRSRFQRWVEVPHEFCRFVETGGLAGEWADVLERIRLGPLPKYGGGKRVMRLREAVKAALAHETTPMSAAGPGAKDTRECERDYAMAQPLLPPLVNKKCVTTTMLAVFVAELAPSALPWISGADFPRRVLPDRPLLGAPMRLPGMAHAPVNEMGVMMLFGMVAVQLGFVIELVQAAFPDCLAKIEVEPGRWQYLKIEFEYESRAFQEHGHDPKGCDMIVCWRHNWKGCPPHLQVLELSKVVCI